MLNHRHARPKLRLRSAGNLPVARHFQPEVHVNQRIRGKRMRGQQNVCLPYTPPETWHEPQEQPARDAGYRVIVDRPGDGYRFAVTPEEVRARLAQLPAAFTQSLQVVHFSAMTRKKRCSPCYGMQWGATIYLYPIEADLIEHYDQPPRPSQLIEARMYGGQWRELGKGQWQLIWTEATVRDFFLNNILIHELGHLLDERNSRTIDRERYAEWFAIEYGYRPTQAERQARRA